MVKIMERRRLWFALSGLILLPGIISFVLWGLPLGIDFKGGSLSEYRTTTTQSPEQGSESIKTIYREADLGEPRIQTDQQREGEQRFFVKSESIEEGKHRQIMQRLGELDPPMAEVSFETIDPQVGSEVTRRAILAIGVASAAIILYIALSFRGVPPPASSWQFGVIAVIALLHDVVFIIGFASVMGHFADWEVNADFVTATLTVMGFSVHDTIVVFDRLRENLKRHASNSFQQVANMSIAQTLARSLNTSLTVILVLLAVVLLGGTTIRPFALILLIGITVGTYSSLFVATPLLDWWQIIRPRIPRLRLSRFKARRSRKTRSLTQAQA